MSKVIKVCELRDLKSTKALSFHVENKEIAVCQVNGKYFAFDNECTHQFGILSDGWLEDYKIECPLHGAQFDIRDGKALCMPAVDDITAYEVIIRDGEVLVKMDD